MTIRVHISESFYRCSLDVYVIRQSDDGKYILRKRDDHHRWEELPPPTAALTDGREEPSFEIPLDVGHALLDALVHHYQGAEDTRALRRDYDAERKRVDEQAKVIAEVARTLATRSTLGGTHAGDPSPGRVA